MIRMGSVLRPTRISVSYILFLEMSRSGCSSASVEVLFVALASLPYFALVIPIGVLSSLSSFIR